MAAQTAAGELDNLIAQHAAVDQMKPADGKALDTGFGHRQRRSAAAAVDNSATLVYAEQAVAYFLFTGFPA